jgi:hypothetical protein
MAWMFAGTEQDMTVGMHLHYHYLPPYMPPTPFYPHPAIGQIRDKLCGAVKADNRKAAKTGSKTKILLPPHLPIIGPLCTGVPKENTGIQQVWMGAGIGVHPFGGIGFVILEGKPAAGMLSNCLGCWSVAPGFDMMLPFIGLDFVMVPTRGVSVLYGPAPLALDLFVLLLSLLRDLFDWILSKVPDGFWKDVLSDAFDSIMVGAEVFCDAIEQGKSPMEALKMGAQATAYTFVDKSLTRAINAVTAPVDKFLKNNPWADTALKTMGVDTKKMKEGVKDWALGKFDEHVAGGNLGEGKKHVDDMGKRNTEADAPNPIGFITDPMEKFGAAANESANKQKEAWDKQKAASADAKQKAADQKKIMNDPNSTPEQKEQARKDYNQAKKDQRTAEKNASQIGNNMADGDKFWGGAADKMVENHLEDKQKDLQKDAAKGVVQGLGLENVFGDPKAKEKEANKNDARENQQPLPPDDAAQQVQQILNGQNLL